VRYERPVRVTLPVLTPDELPEKFDAVSDLEIFREPAKEFELVPYEKI